LATKSTCDRSHNRTAGDSTLLINLYFEFTGSEAVSGFVPAWLLVFNG
jgi:hypothetical protein